MKKSNDQLIEHHPAKQPVLGLLGRITRSMALVLGIFGSLMVFPAGVGILVVAWLAVISVLVLRKRSGQAGIGCLLLAGILICKTPELTIRIFVLLSVLVTWGVFCVQAKGRTSEAGKCVGSFAWLALALIATWFVVGRWLDGSTFARYELDPKRPIVCLGDSLAEGTHGGYPAVLDNLLPAEVLNFGRNGYTTDAAIKELLPQIELLSPAPQLVVVELGGHDYKDGRSRSRRKSSFGKSSSGYRLPAVK